jgi:small subunit ribosomal protein S4
MGDPRKTRKHFKRPLKIWDRENIEREKALKQTYGLKNKREIWRAETILRKKRNSARSLLALALEERLKREKELLQSLARLGILNEKAGLDDVLTLTVESFLERRLQTLVWRKGLANTTRQARQFITHGHIAIAGKKVGAPSYLVTAEEENKIGYYAGKKMVLRPAIKEKKPAAKEKKKVSKEFEEAKPSEGEDKEKKAREKEQPKKEGKKPALTKEKEEPKEGKKLVEKKASEPKKEASKPKEKKAKAKGVKE